MAAKIAEHITQKLIMESIIEEGERELYCYGFFLLTTRLFFFLVTIATGLITCALLESILFYMVFMLLRTYAGGAHAKTETACTILTTLALAVSVFGIKAMELANNDLISRLMLTVGSLCIFIFSPLDTKDKPLTNQEKSYYRTICYILISLCIAISTIAQILQINIVNYSVACGIFLEGILLSIGKFCIPKD